MRPADKDTMIGIVDLAQAEADLAAGRLGVRNAVGCCGGGATGEPVEFATTGRRR